MKSVNLTWRAQEDIERLVDFMNKRVPFMEKRLRVLLIDKLISLSIDYDLGVPLGTDIRETYAKLGRSRYVLRYRVLEHEVIILRIWHGREGRA